jgi:hypothetical protein
MGQQPNVEITLRDLPAAKPEPGASGRWSPDRPGDPAGPDEVPWGGRFGRPGPDAGFARALAAEASLDLAAGERRRDAEAAVAAVAAARASHFGRGPVAADVALAAVVLGYDTAGLPPEVSEHTATVRRPLVADLARKAHKAAALIDAVSPELLVGDLASAREAAAAGAVL